MRKIISIDRIDGEVIVAEAENCEIITLTQADFADPPKATVCYFLGDDLKYHRDVAETEKRKKKNRELLKSLIREK